jgi:hypothetical protein
MRVAVAYVIAACALALPLVVHRLMARGGAYSLAPRLLASISIFIIECVLVMPAALWGGPPPGVGHDAEVRYALSAPVIAALAQYHLDNLNYPQSLAERVPKYMSLQKQNELVAHDVDYVGKVTSYELSFRYYGRGTNYCQFKSQLQRWECHGAS